MKWFKHDSRANRDSKIEKVLIKYGADGYALYWLCLELIADRIDKDNISFDLEHDAETLGHRLKIDTLRVEEIMKYFIELKLFECTDGIITCLKLANRLENSIVKNPTLKEVKEKIRDNPGFSEKSPARLDKIRIDKNRINKSVEKNLIITSSYIPIWNLWTEYKLTQHRFRYKTSSSEQIALDNLVSLSNNNPVEAERLVKRAIVNGWKGIYSDTKTAPPSIPPTPPRPKIWTGPAEESPEMTPEEKAEQLRIIAEYEARKGVKHGS